MKVLELCLVCKEHYTIHKLCVSCRRKGITLFNHFSDKNYFTGVKRCKGDYSDFVGGKVDRKRYRVKLKKQLLKDGYKLKYQDS